MTIADSNIKTSGKEEHWLMDSGTTVLHVTNNDEGMTDVVPSNQQVVIGDGTTLTPTKKGTFRLVNTKNQVLILHNVLHVPTFKKNIISVGSLMARGNTLAPTESAMILERNSATMHLTPLQNMFYFVGHRRLDEVHNNAAGTNAPSDGDGDGDNDDKTADKKKKPPSPVDINEVHNKMGHFGEAMLQKTYQDMGTKLSGKLKPCDGCLHVKAKWKATSKVSSLKATEPNE
jgi:hypothetical protein